MPEQRNMSLQVLAAMRVEVWQEVSKPLTGVKVQRLHLKAPSFRSTCVMQLNSQWRLERITHEKACAGFGEGRIIPYETE